jgi:hypothetical protein
MRIASMRSSRDEDAGATCFTESSRRTSSAAPPSDRSLAAASAAVRDAIISLEGPVSSGAPGAVATVAEPRGSCRPYLMPALPITTAAVAEVLATWVAATPESRVLPAASRAGLRLRFIVVR